MAVKIIEHSEGSPGSASSGGKRISARREMLVATSISHPNVVRSACMKVIDVWQSVQHAGVCCGLLLHAACKAANVNKGNMPPLPACEPSTWLWHQSVLALRKACGTGPNGLFFSSRSVLSLPAGPDVPHLYHDCCAPQRAGSRMAQGGRSQQQQRHQQRGTPRRCARRVCRRDQRQQQQQQQRWQR